MSEQASAPPASHVVVTFALPDESRRFVGLLDRRVRTVHRDGAPALPTIFGELAGKIVTVVHTGVGDTPEGRERLKSILDLRLPMHGVISAGYAGGLRKGIRVGDLILATNFSDPAFAENARRLLVDESLHSGPLTTQSHVAETAAAKSALAAETGALAVDMETGWIAEICAPAGVRMLSLRVISDAAEQPLPVPGHILFDVARQRPRYLALPAWLLAHPGRIAPFVGFVRGLGPARARLTHALRLLVADR